MPPPPRYRQLADHYLQAIRAGSLQTGDRLPSLRKLMQLHGVSLSTALQVCRTLESEGWAEARDRSGYLVRRPHRLRTSPMDEPEPGRAPEPAQFVGIHQKVSDFVTRQRYSEVRLDLSVARGAPALYPGDALRAAMVCALRQRPQMLAQPSSSRGSTPLREAAAQRAVRIGMALAPADVLPTQGCIEALNLALRAVAQPGDTVAVESPTFYGLLQVLESLGMRALEIPTSPRTGLSIEALELAIAAYGDIKAVVVVPHLQNPLGSVMPDTHKARLVALCASHAIALIEDDTYSELLDAPAPPRALKSFDRSGSVIHCASLHKVLAPGLRLGWIHAGRWHARVEMLKYAQSRCNEELGQWAAGSFMATGAYDRHLRQLREKLRVQRERTADAIARHFPRGTRINLPPGGLQLWVELPEQLPAMAVFDAALREHILVAPGPLFSDTRRCDHFLRINCGWPWSDELQAGLRRLGEITAAALAVQAARPLALPRGGQGMALAP
ncbi:PLP-dependent aminotransferase family protein [Pseudorhodoferax sp.]|uniref:aminotransferase-like domain-containing protein n=1 Tax=Pseudorhodoferax sp. TaxID=1993553 RepID=UPI0039E4842E